MVLQTPPPRGAQATMRAALLIAAAAGALAFAPVQPPVSLRASAAFARPATRREGLASGLRVGRTRPLLGGLHASAASGQATDAAAAATVRKGVTPSDLEAFDAQVRARHDQHNNEIMNDLFRPVTKESEAPLPGRILAGAVPSDFPGGALLKNGPNAHFEASGGWLDGDGMVHCCVVSPAGDDEFTAYSRAWVRTEAFKKEEAAGRRLFDGSLVAPKGLGVLWALFLNTVRALQPQKDTANTGLLPIGGGRVLAMMEQALPSELQVFRDGSFVTTRSRAFEKQLVDLSRYPFSGGALTAHLHTDPASGEAVGVSYPSLGEPSVLIHTFPPGGAPPTVAPVKLQGELQSMVHDCALTSAEGSAHGGYAVILDLPMTVRPERMLRDEFPVNYEQGGAARVGLWPRRGGGDEARWFDIEPCVVLHTFNAHQDGDKVVLTAPRTVPSGRGSFIETFSTAFPYRWTFDLATGAVTEECLSATSVEFPQIDPRLTGKDARFGFAITPWSVGGPVELGPPNEGVLFDGVVKMDLQTGEVTGRWDCPPGWFVVSEPTFVAKQDSSAGDGDQGYLMVWITRPLDAAGRVRGGTEQVADDEIADAEDPRASRVVLIDAAAMPPPRAGDKDAAGMLSGGAVAVVGLPAAVPYGLHSAFVPFDELLLRGQR